MKFALRMQIGLGGITMKFKGDRSTSMKYLFAIIIASLIANATVTHAAVSISATLQPGDTLYMRYGLIAPSQIPATFNTLYPDWRFDMGRTNPFAWKMDLYNDAGTEIVASSGVRESPPINLTFLGVSPSISDPSLGGNPQTFLHGNLASFADGDGLLSLTWVSGLPATFVTFDIAYATTIGNNGTGIYLPFRLVYAVNALPPQLPEPASAGLVFISTALLARRWRVNGPSLYHSAD
jgi:hypothetical protein